MVVLATVAAWATISMIAGGKIDNTHGRGIDRANPARYNQLAPRRGRAASSQCIRMSRPLRSTSPLVLEELPLSVTRRDDRGSDDELEERDRAAKRRRIEQLAEEYRHGQTLFIASAALRGPLDHGDWGNPWRKKRPVQRHRSRITNDEEGTGDQRCRPQSRRRQNAVRRGETSGEHPKKKRKTPPPREAKNRDSRRDSRQPPRSRTMERTLQPDQLPREENSHAKMPDDDNQDIKAEHTSNRHPTNPISEGSEVRQCTPDNTAVSDRCISLQSTQMPSHHRQTSDVSKARGLQSDRDRPDREDGQDGKSGSRAVSPTPFGAPRMTDGAKEIPHPQEMIDSGIPRTGSDTKPGSTGGIGPSPTKPRERSGAGPHPQSMTKSLSTERVGRNSDHPPEMGSVLQDMDGPGTSRSEMTSWSTVLPLFASNRSTEHQDGPADPSKLEQDIEDAGSWLHQSSDINWDLSRCSGKSGTNPQNPVSAHGAR